MLSAPWISSKKRLIRSPVNPIDKSTVFSIFPVKIKEKKETIEPSKFSLEPGSYDSPSRLVVGGASWWRDSGHDEEPIVEIPTGSILIAKSLVDDYCNSMIEFNASTAKPGLFFLPGDISVADLKKSFTKDLVEARDKQIQWYKNLVNKADILWAQHASPRAIADLMRLAAKELNVTGKAWMGDFKAASLIPCTACGELRNPLYPVCRHCNRTIDSDLAKKANIVEQPKA